MNIIKNILKIFHGSGYSTIINEINVLRKQNQEYNDRINSLVEDKKSLQDQLRIVNTETTTEKKELLQRIERMSREHERLYDSLKSIHVKLDEKAGELVELSLQKQKNDVISKFKTTIFRSF